MKKYLAPALAIALIGVSVASIAQFAPMDHSSRGMSMMGMSHDGKFGPMDNIAGRMMGMNPGEMQAMREAMQQKMSAAKTDEERRALMTEQQKLMMEKRSQMMSSNGNGQSMNGMPGNMPERQQMMQKRIGMGMMPL